MERNMVLVALDGGLLWINPIGSTENANLKLFQLKPHFFSCDSKARKVLTNYLSCHYPPFRSIYVCRL